MTMALAVALGGGIGSLFRHYAVLAAAMLFGSPFPFGTLFVNVAGSFAMGILVELAAHKWQAGPDMRAFLMTGFLGGFTTFSAFSLDVMKMTGAGQGFQAFFYVVLSVVLSIAAVFGGVWLARAWWGV